MFNALVSLILFCTFWCKLYSLGVQVQRQSIEVNSGNRNTVHDDLKLPVLTFEDKITWRARSSNLPKEQEEYTSHSTKTAHMKEKARLYNTELKVQKATSLRDASKIRKPRTQRRKHKVGSNEWKKKNESLSLSKRLRKVLEGIEEDERKEETISSESPHSLQAVKVSSPKVEEDKGEMSGEKNTVENKKVRVTPPSLNKRRRLIISDQRGLSFILEPNVVSHHIYEQRISTLYQKNDNQTESSIQTLGQKEGPKDSATHHVVRDISKEQLHQPNFSVVDHREGNKASDIRQNINNSLNMLSMPPVSVDKAFDSAPGLASIAFQSGQTSQSHSRQRRIRHRR
ncbi:hypothetical protein Gasu2_27670 [Galdieria sulphuraria]|uniref:Uncharacterized protein n=1 Tax=Galdieria sulphuraria TaxID=130081 RepID=M2W3L5_GALSU|nr:uncharacterized protein Gasu_24470 [Galdieria sulphuraria]EME30301.1 hypothetical protein Gasu_24470 [Galdieria sulphuraria]GJD08465.1 hypothetical protein Gasu2_27670 [Galdieria sulphuraria]|eukprot:XP_005706821.1 hypothetical protein Gasu_24470 [Galdieria sulphuraria]